ncbi:growth-regulating factor 2-like [Salvia miltiorrhiza]|uniref:growth-regulating factor 2-like n=1 Tax=Salvia miltiorrhiza TaxID=226208 RepID=UPI0025AC2E74|nr:growth-regulating factor 2-like [Salvia miltiorrhiza]
MDSRLVQSLVSSLSATAPSNHADISKLTLYGSAFLNAECADLRPAKLPKISSCAGEMPNTAAASTAQMLAFSAPPAAFPFFTNSSGYGCTSMHGPFTPSQWMELEHQAFIYKYITANVPIPSYLLNPIRKALEHSGFSCFSLLRPNALTDPEPGRCRRTDGKKWRCSRDALADHKYCDRHINRGRHRSRKPVEGGATTNHHTPRCPKDKETPKMCMKDKQCNGSLLKPLDETELSMGLGVGAVASKRWGGGPLGEALHTTSNGPGKCKALNLIPSSPLGVLGGTG